MRGKTLSKSRMRRLAALLTVVVVLSASQAVMADGPKLELVTAAPGALKIKWSYVVVDSFTLFYKLGRNAATQQKSFPGDQLDYEYTFTEIGAATYYEIRIEALSSNVIVWTESLPSGYTSGNPATPTLVKAEEGPDFFTLDWSDVAEISNYHLYIFDGTTQVLSRTSLTDSQYTLKFDDHGLDYSKSYRYEVLSVAYNSVTSLQALTGTFKAKPLSAPQNLKVTESDISHISIAWDEVTYADSYTVYRSESENGSFAKIDTPTAKSYKDTKVSPNKAYWYKVKAVRSTRESEYSEAVAASAGDVMPDTPEGLSVSIATPTSAALTWNEAKNALGYQVLRSENTNGGFQVIGTSNTTRYTDENLEPGKTYYYCVKSVNGTVVSAQSPVVKAVVPEDTASRPVLTNPAVGEREITVSWTAIDGAISYRIYRSETASGEYVKVAEVESPATSWSDTSLEPGKTYYYKISSVNASKVESKPSEALKVTTAKEQGTEKKNSGEVNWILIGSLLFAAGLSAGAAVLLYRRRAKALAAQPAAAYPVAAGPVTGQPSWNGPAAAQPVRGIPAAPPTWNGPATAQPVRSGPATLHPGIRQAPTVMQPRPAAIEPPSTAMTAPTDENRQAAWDWFIGDNKPQEYQETRYIWPDEGRQDGSADKLAWTVFVTEEEQNAIRTLSEIRAVRAASAGQTLTEHETRKKPALCPRCYTEVETGSDFCPGCGYPLTAGAAARQ